MSSRWGWLPWDKTTRTIGTAAAEDTGIRFHYLDDDWKDDRGTLSDEGGVITLQEIGNEANWKLVFKRSADGF